MRPPATDPGPPPDEGSLRQAALTHLSRYSTTQAGLLGVLTRRIQRWAHRAEAPADQVSACLQAARLVVSRLADIGAVDDAAFAAGRTRSLQRAGRSRRAITAHLQMKGVPAALAVQPDDPAADLAAALLYAHRRRMGPFRLVPRPDERPRDLARLARAGFSADVANRILSLPPDEAETLLLEARRA
jgi:regulatory protein